MMISPKTPKPASIFGNTWNYAWGRVRGYLFKPPSEEICMPVLCFSLICNISNNDHLACEKYKTYTFEYELAAESENPLTAGFVISSNQAAASSDRQMHSI